MPPHVSALDSRPGNGGIFSKLTIRWAHSTGITSKGNLGELDRFLRSNLQLEAIYCFKIRIWRQICSNSNSNAGRSVASQFWETIAQVMPQQGLSNKTNRVNYESFNREIEGGSNRPGGPEITSRFRLIRQKQATPQKQPASGRGLRTNLFGTGPS